ncbi:hypothetical protein G6O52_25875 [Salmonella enterica subsp. enterica serovar Heidelberg]|nr:hypothetical protein [Salmonella enterica subsp. enterica serovar Heidelberg]
MSDDIGRDYILPGRAGQAGSLTEAPRRDLALRRCCFLDAGRDKRHVTEYGYADLLQSRR